MYDFSRVDWTLMLGIFIVSILFAIIKRI